MASPEADVQESHRFGGGQHPQGVSADGIEGNITQVKQAGKTDHDVQPQPHQDIDTNVVQDLAEIAAQDDRQQECYYPQHRQSTPANYSLLAGTSFERNGLAVATLAPIGEIHQ